jgi:hypothetical protein
MFEFLAIALLITLLILLLTFKSDVQSRISILQIRIDQLTAELKKHRDSPTKTEEQIPVTQKTEIPLVIKEVKPQVVEVPKEEPDLSTPVKPEINSHHLFNSLLTDRLSLYRSPQNLKSRGSLNAIRILKNSLVKISPIKLVSQCLYSASDTL